VTFAISAIARLKPGLTLQQAQADVQRGNRHSAHPQAAAGRRSEIHPYDEMVDVRWGPRPSRAGLVTPDPAQRIFACSSRGRQGISGIGRFGRRSGRRQRLVRLLLTGAWCSTYSRPGRFLLNWSWLIDPIVRDAGFVRRRRRSTSTVRRRVRTADGVATGAFGVMPRCASWANTATARKKAAARRSARARGRRPCRR
jgi:hypothetical protein